MSEPTNYPHHGYPCDRGAFPMPPHPHCGGDFFPHANCCDKENAGYVQNANVVKNAECVHHTGNVEVANVVHNAVNVQQKVVVDEYLDDSQKSANAIANRTIAKAVIEGQYPYGTETKDTYAPIISANDKRAPQAGAVKKFVETYAPHTDRISGGNTGVPYSTTVYVAIKYGIGGSDNTEELYENAVTADSKKAVQSGAVNTALQGVYTDVKAGTYGTDDEELFENTVTEDSKKAVQSGAVYSALQSKLTIPELPSDDGTYTLQLVIADGTPTFSWVSA